MVGSVWHCAGQYMLSTLSSSFLCSFLSSVCEKLVHPEMNDNICLKCDCEHEIRNTWLIYVRTHICLHMSVRVCMRVCTSVSNCVIHATPHTHTHRHIPSLPPSLPPMQPAVAITLIVIFLIAIYVCVVVPLLQLFFKYKGRRGAPAAHRPLNEVPWTHTTPYISPACRRGRGVGFTCPSPSRLLRFMKFENLMP